jgi:hypothetical protein
MRIKPFGVAASIYAVFIDLVGADAGEFYVDGGT